MSGKLRVGVVGAGWWAVANHLPILKSRPDVELLAVCRLGRAELANVQSTFGIPYAAEDFAAMPNEAAMDALVVASPHNLHGAHTIAALAKGIHVLVEKPMTVDAAEARAIAPSLAKRAVTSSFPMVGTSSRISQKRALSSRAGASAVSGTSARRWLHRSAI